MKGRQETVYLGQELTLSMVDMVDAIRENNLMTLGDLGRAIGAKNSGFHTTYKNLCRRLAVPESRAYEQFKYIIELFDGKEEATDSERGAYT